MQTKCHQYWPNPPDVMEHGSFHIRCQSEDCTIAYVFREMLVTNTEVSGARVAGAVGGVCALGGMGLPQAVRVGGWAVLL